MPVRTMPTRTLFLHFYLQSILFRRLELKEWNLTQPFVWYWCLKCYPKSWYSRQKNKKNQVKKLIQTVLYIQNFHYDINNKKKLYFQEKIAENKNLKEVWQTLKSVGMPSNGGRQFKISLKENGAVSFDLKKNANTFCRFFSHLAGSLLQKLTCQRNIFGIKTTEEYYKQIRKVCEDFVLHNVVSQSNIS